MRITPAGAGKTINRPNRKTAAQDHPRRCGENMQGSCDDAFGRGSPPQVRGKPESCLSLRERYRITPAGAGKTSAGRYSTYHSQDHPRRCGENYQLFFPGEGLRGSPPQVRGKRVFVRKALGKDWITPAGAGKTHWAGIHPPKPPGSPPQVRGKRGRASAQRRRKRITPAGAGKTTFMVVGTAGEEDHPRRCGENRAFFRSHRTASGSPPQVRGKPFRFLLRLHKLRITPAGAGKTNLQPPHRLLL